MDCSLISIVIPVYNRTVYLGPTIDSVLTQSHSNWELVVVDDGSEEDVAGFVARYSDRRIELLSQPNQGNAVARNTGIQASSSEFVICLDSDDCWHAEMLQTCVNMLQSHPEVDVAFTQRRSIDDQGTPLPQPVGPKGRNGNLLEPLLLGYPILPSSALVRRRCFQQWGMYTPGLDDWELWLRWAARGCRFACIERPLVYYRIHDQNYNLDWARRRAAHFAMLDTFYGRENLPPKAGQMRQQAYANQHLHFAVLGWQVGRGVDAVAEFASAVQVDPSLLGNLDFYTRIACAHQNRLDYGTARNLDLTVARSIVTRSLNALFGRADLAPSIRSQHAAAYGWANLALARLAYALPHDMGQARRLLLRSLAHWPPIAWQTDWVAWLGRALVGYAPIQQLKLLLQVCNDRAEHAHG
jgi:GT2 family glycosyltransferase